MMLNRESSSSSKNSLVLWTANQKNSVPVTSGNCSQTVSTRVRSLMWKWKHLWSRCRRTRESLLSCTWQQKLLLSLHRWELERVWASSLHPCWILQFSLLLEDHPPLSLQLLRKPNYNLKHVFSILRPKGGFCPAWSYRDSTYPAPPRPFSSESQTPPNAAHQPAEIKEHLRSRRAIRNILRQHEQSHKEQTEFIKKKRAVPFQVSGHFVYVIFLSFLFFRKMLPPARG